MKKKRLLFSYLFSMILAFNLNTDAGSKITIKLGSLAPEGTPFSDIIYNTREQWQAVSNGKIKLRVYPGGISGSEPDMIRKMKIGQLHAASLSAMGIILIDPAYGVLQLPGMINSVDELDYCLEKLTPAIEERMQKKGYTFLSYCDLGPLYFFTSKKVTTVEQLKNLKLCVFATDSDSKKLWSKAGFKTIDLPLSEVLTGLQTGLIDGFIHTPIYTLSMQWFAKAKYMVKVPYGFGLAATVIKNSKWNKIDKELQKEMKKISFAETAKELAEIRKLDAKAISAMKKYGLEIFTPDKNSSHNWIKSIEEVYPQIRGTLIPEDIFDQAMKIRKEYRSRGSK